MTPELATIIHDHPHLLEVDLFTVEDWQEIAFLLAEMVVIAGHAEIPSEAEVLEKRNGIVTLVLNDLVGGDQ